MEMKVEVISREIIKPSSPTPPHLKTYDLSLLDQIQPPFYIPFVFFYSADSNNQNKDQYIQQSHRLRDSLSETLTRFYPLAGRIKDNRFAECDDAGVDYVQAQVNCKLSDVLGRPEIDLMHPFLPCGIVINTEALDSSVLLAVQASFFDCGGLAIGICIQHKICDAATLATFINCWAATARGDSDSIVTPTFDSSSIFPPKTISQFNPETGEVGEKIIERRFLFDASKVAALRAKVACNSTLPTRVEAIAALIWTCSMRASRLRSESLKPSMLMLTVNMRKKMKPPLPSHSFGNLLTVATAISTSKTESDWLGLVDQLHHATSVINNDYIHGYVEQILSKCEQSELQDDSSNQRPEPNFSGEMEMNIISSLCRSGFYKADFGWGEPAWVRFVHHVRKNLSFLMDTNEGEGIEAWVSLAEEDMAIFEQDPELLEFTSLVNEDQFRKYKLRGRL